MLIIMISSIIEVDQNINLVEQLNMVIIFFRHFLLRTFDDSVPQILFDSAQVYGSYHSNKYKGSEVFKYQYFCHCKKVRVGAIGIWVLKNFWSFIIFRKADEE